MSRDHQELMNSTYEKFRSGVEWRRRFEAAGLTNLEKVAVLFGNLNYQVENGGLSQYVFNSYASDVGPGGAPVHLAIAGAADEHRELDPELADCILDMMRLIDGAPDERETEEEVVDRVQDEETGEWEDVTETVSLRDRHFAEADGLDTRYYAFQQDRRERFYQSVLDAWNPELDPFALGYAFESRSARPADRTPPAPSSGDVRYPGVSVALVGQDGNAHSILARVERALRQARVPREEIAAFRKEAQAGDYDHLLGTVMKWVDCDGPEPSPGRRPGM